MSRTFLGVEFVRYAPGTREAHAGHLANSLGSLRVYDEAGFARNHVLKRLSRRCARRHFLGILWPRAAAWVATCSSWRTGLKACRTRGCCMEKGHEGPCEVEEPFDLDEEFS